MTAAPSPWAWQPPRPSRLVEAASLMRLTGPDSLRVLHGQTSQVLEGARPGQCLAACSIGPTARLRALAEVMVVEDGAWLVVTAGDGSQVHQALDRVLFPADQVQLGPVIEAVLVTPIGPPAPTSPLPCCEPGTWQPFPPSDGEGWLLGERLLWPAGSPLPAPWSELAPLEPAEQERWRLRFGRAAAPGEINGETNPFELGLADRVSLSKGCYVGQETLAKLCTYDGVKQQLRRFVALSDGSEGDAALTSAGTPLTTTSGERAGRITSALALPATPGESTRVIGLALVRRQTLDEPLLWAGAPGSGGLGLTLSIPEGFVAPPVGAGRPA